MIEHGSSKNFDDLVSSGVVLIDFFADWCGPCRMLETVLSDFSSSHGDVKIVKVNVDDEGELARKFGVMSIPTLILFKDANEVKKNVGFMSQEELIDWIRK
jgi:thioredoxin 1